MSSRVRKNIIRLCLAVGLPAIALFGFQNCSDVKFGEDPLTAEELALQTEFMMINKGAPYTNQTAVTIQLNVSGGQQMYITNDPTCQTGGVWETYAENRGWYLEDKNQKVNVYGIFKRKKANGFPETTECIDANITHDDIPPEMDFVKAPGTYSVSAKSLIEWTAEDKLSGIDHLMCATDMGQPISCDRQLEMDNLTEGVHRFAAVAHDKAGNFTPVSLSWLVDLTPPTIKLVAPIPAGVTTSMSAAFNFEAKDAGAGIDKVYCKIDAAAFAACTTPFTKSGMAQGPHTFSAYAVDKAGHKSAVMSYDWLVDSAPVGGFSILGISGGTADQNPDQYLAGGLSPRLHWSASENAVKYEVAILNAAGTGAVCPLIAVNALNHQFACSLVDGATYTAVATAYNSINRAISAAPYKFLVDASGPVIKITTPVQENVEQNEAIVKFSITDAISGVANATCYHTYNSNTVERPCADLTSMTLSGLLPGQHTFNISATDKAGNKSESAVVTFDLEARMLEQYTVQIPNAITKLDVLAVIDNSGSMDAERKAFGTTLKNFISKLNGLDWRVCITTTSPKTDGALAEIYKDKDNADAPVYYIDSKTPNYETLFMNKVTGNLGDASGDEQGIYTTVRMVERVAASKTDSIKACIRSDAALAAVVISDEDERSWGGYDEYIGKSQFFTLNTKNKPPEALNIIRNTLGAAKSFIYHSLVIKYPDVDNCLKISAGQYGRRYQEMSALTSGIVGSLCAADYGKEMEKMAEQTKQTIDNLNLKCSPVAGTLEVKADNKVPVFTVSGNKVSFTPALPPGTLVSLKYYCAK